MCLDWYIKGITGFMSYFIIEELGERGIREIKSLVLYYQIITQI